MQFSRLFPDNYGKKIVSANPKELIIINAFEQRFRASVVLRFGQSVGDAAKKISGDESLLIDALGAAVGIGKHARELRALLKKDAIEQLDAAKAELRKVVSIAGTASAM